MKRNLIKKVKIPGYDESWTNYETQSSYFICKVKNKKIEYEWILKKDFNYEFILDKDTTIFGVNLENINPTIL